ncbi:MAG: polysaccharide deacetylase [Ruminococcaceae bacterium]|nr:polysaccharide deacetylase [Oscillospiraceae bacterium]
MAYRFLRFPEGKAKAVTLSYDDGCRDDIRMAQTITKYGIKGTFNITTPAEEPNLWRLTADEIREHILENGHEVAVHGACHRAEGTLRPIEGIQDVLECRKNLEKAFGRIIRGMAYPDSGIVRFSNGASYSSVKNYLTELDIAYARTLGGDNDSFMLPADWHAWMPTAHHINPQIFEYIDKFLETRTDADIYSAARYPRLFYLWGHSFEFERNKDWDKLEKICEKLSGRDDIWYATNIEIYDYVKAYESLIYSADGSMAYNPTLYTIWFDYDKKLYTIKPGETINI